MGTFTSKHRRHSNNIGTIKITPCSSSKIGLNEENELVKIKTLKDGSIKVYEEKGEFLCEKIVPVRIFAVTDNNFYEYLHTSFPYLIRDNIKEGDTVLYGKRNGYAYARKERWGEMFINKTFNLNLPRNFITLLGYSDHPNNQN